MSEYRVDADGKLIGFYGTKSRALAVVAQALLMHQEVVIRQTK